MPGSNPVLINQPSVPDDARHCFRRLLTAAALCSCLTGPDGTIAEVNDRLCELVGRPREKLIGEPWLSVLQPTAEVQREPAAAGPLRVNGRAGAIDVLVSSSIIGPDGPAGDWMLHFIEMAPAPLTEVNRQLAGDLERTRRELAEASRWLNTLLENLPVAVFATDAGGILTMARGTILPEATKARVGRPISESYAHVPELVEAVSRALAGDDQTMSLSGGGRTFEFIVYPIRGDGGVAGALGAVIEVTHHLEAALARAESAHKSRFLSAISHELRTPLNSILGFAQLLSLQHTAPLDSRQLRYVANIESSGRHLLSLITELLDLSKIEAGQMVLQIQAIPPGSAVRDAIETMCPVAEANRVAVRAGRQTRTRVLADPIRLRQILLNLTSNAIKFTGAGGQVAITSVRRGQEVLFRVEDTGKGISDEDHDRVFDDFYQVPTSGPARADGTGLGLPLSRRLARAMGGELSVKSTPGSGSTFTLRLPASGSGVADSVLTPECHSMGV